MDGAHNEFEQGKTYTDPQTQAFLGINADDIGSGEILATEGDVATLSRTQEIYVTMWSRPDKRYAARVRSVAGAADPATPASTRSFLDEYLRRGGRPPAAPAGAGSE